MPNDAQITYTNRNGRTYYLCEVAQRNGRTRFVFSREPRGKPVTLMPAGCEPAESVNGQVSLRKVGTSPISQAEVQCVRAALDRHTRLAGYRVEVRKETIVIHEPQGGIDPGRIFQPEVGALTSHGGYVCGVCPTECETWIGRIRSGMKVSKRESVQTGKREFREQRSGSVRPRHSQSERLEEVSVRSGSCCSLDGSTSARVG